ncbi:hypothetical protein ACFWOJ_21795 [Streptomyces sp. NPDC058439]|uniref:hypothetical protein n=1 Tax=Streptomyces sp. NPDC058439 TaxID=3346500 RepID=UPI003666F6D5
MCDTKTNYCAKTPYERGAQDPAWPLRPLMTAGVCVALAVLGFVTLLVAGWRTPNIRMRT